MAQDGGAAQGIARSRRTHAERDPCPCGCLDQRACINIFHVTGNASTLLTKTALDGLWLQFFQTKSLSVIGPFAKKL